MQFLTHLIITTIQSLLSVQKGIVIGIFIWLFWILGASSLGLPNVSLLSVISASVVLTLISQIFKGTFSVGALPNNDIENDIESTKNSETDHFK